VTGKVNALLAGRDYAGAVKLLDEARRESSDRSARAYYLLRTGEVYGAYLAEPARAADYFREAVRTDPSGPDARRAKLRLAELLENDLKDYGGALYLFSEMARDATLDPRGAMQAQLAVARCYRKMGNFAQARIEYQNLLAADLPMDLKADAALDSGDVGMILGEPLRAMESYRQAEKWGGTARQRAMAQMGQGRAAEQLGNLAEAKGHYETALSGGGHPYPDQVRARIEKLGGRLTQAPPAVQ
jgi:tetratricopeptide (TPR) repeat protein